MVKVCPECGSSSLETLIEEAQTYCADCGVVVERGSIVNEVTFVETNGQANVVGQFVGESGARRVEFHWLARLVLLSSSPSARVLGCSRLPLLKKREINIRF